MLSTPIKRQRVMAKLIENLNTELCCNQRLQPLVAQPDVGLLVASLPPMGHLPPGSGRYSDLVTSQHAELCMYECPTWKQRGLNFRFYGGTSQAIHTSGAPLVQVRLTQTP